MRIQIAFRTVTKYLRSALTAMDILYTETRMSTFYNSRKQRCRKNQSSILI
jgi:hypothetical protein